MLATYMYNFEGIHLYTELYVRIACFATVATQTWYNFVDVQKTKLYFVTRTSRIAIKEFNYSMNKIMHER